MNIIKFIIKIIIEIFFYIFKYKNYEDTIISLLGSVGEYNIIFVKIFQWTCINNNSEDNKYITDRIVNEIHSYTNNTPYNDSDINYKSLLDIYLIAQKKGDIFELDDLKPINSGSISLVFKAKLNNKNIAVKILRKNIKEKLESGLELLINIEYIMYHIPFFNKYSNTKIFEKNKLNILNQINFTNESENLLIFYNDFKNNKYIMTPNVYVDYTNLDSNIILMDFIDGKYLYELENNELNNYFHPFLKFIMDSLFIKNIFHCDLHQGNILFFCKVTNGKIIYRIGIIDMGMVTKINIDEINFIYLWLNGIFNYKFLELIEYMENINNHSHIFENNTTNEKCFKHIRNLYNKKEIFCDLKTEDVIRDTHKFLGIFYKYNCKISSRFSFFILSLIPIFSLLLKLGPNIEKSDYIKIQLDKMSNNSLLD